MEKLNTKDSIENMEVGGSLHFESGNLHSIRAVCSKVKKGTDKNFSVGEYITDGKYFVQVDRTADVPAHKKRNKIAFIRDLEGTEEIEVTSLNEIRSFRASASNFNQSSKTHRVKVESKDYVITFTKTKINQNAG